MECANLLFLILLSRLSYTVRAVEKALDMAPNAVDDSFLGCREKMLNAVTKSDGLLSKELQTTKGFAEMWYHTGTCNKTINGLKSHHITALQSYGNSNNVFRKKFNNMVHAHGNNATTYKNEFPFKSLHFLLTDAMQRLNTCGLVYYETSNQYTAEIGKEVRFGKFIRPSSKMSPDEDNPEGVGTRFNIASCSVVNVENYTCSSEEVELLISPTEVFTVKDVRLVKSDDEDYRMITLTHSRFLSNHDCYLFDRAPGGSSSLLLSSTILSLVASFLSLYYCAAQQ